MISEIIEKWIKGILIDGITGNLSGLFDNVNAKVGEIASDVGSTPQAAIKYANSLNREYVLVPFSKIPSVIKAVDNGEIDEGVVPFENSIEGTVNYTIDSLIFDVNLFIKSEIVIPISHNLMTRPQCAGRRPKKIFSHPQSLAQCKKYLEIGRAHV